MFLVNNVVSSQYPKYIYNKASSFISASCHKISSHLPSIHTISRISKIFLKFLWRYKIWIISAVAMGVIARLIVNYIKNRPIYPTVKIESSLTKAKLSIIKPDGMAPPPPKVNITFCVDASGSMTEETRETQVKAGVNNVLENALKITNTIQGTIVKIAIIGFKDTPWVICQPTTIDNKTFGPLKSSFNNYRSSDNTNIIAGLNFSTEVLEQMAQENSEATHTLILLSDGDAGVDSDSITPIHARLAALHVKLFAVGIGKNHKKQPLQTIAPATGTFTGEYIDTSANNNIAETISKIYEQTIATFSQLELTTPQLPAGTWSIGSVDSVETDDKQTSKCALGNLSRETTIEKIIRIHRKKLTAPFDLSKLVFTLRFADPNGRSGHMTIPWSPNPIINPSICNAQTT